jgi:ankyrin repeat protein
MATHEAVRAIFRAAEEGDTEGVAGMLDGDPRLISSIYPSSWTLLMTVASSGHVHAARLLLERGAEVDARDDQGHTALHHAAFNGEEEMVLILISRGADISTRNSERWTPLMHACLWYGSFWSKRESVGWMREMRTVARL